MGTRRVYLHVIDEVKNRKLYSDSHAFRKVERVEKRHSEITQG